MKKILVLLLLALMLAVVPGETGGRSIKACFNGQEATVTDVVLRPGEPFTIDLYITPDDEADAWAEIEEPGNPRAYDRLSGDALVPTDFKRCNTSAGAHFHWELAANGRWTGGTAPVNIYYQINSRNSNDVIVQGYFTVADAYISPEESPENTAGDTDRKTGKTPSPGVIATLACILAALLTRRAVS